MVNKQYLCENWIFHEKGTDERHNASVPGVIQSDLYKEGVQPDPFFGLNEGLYYPYENKEWVYNCCFDCNDNTINSDVVNLVAEGLDTYADIYLNGNYIGSTQNMFITHCFNIKSLLKKKNNLEIYFKSPVKESEKLKNSSEVEHHSTVNFSRNYVRKAQYSFGWDWAPRFANTGIWRPIYIEYYNKAKIEYFYFSTKHIKDKNAEVAIQGNISKNFQNMKIHAKLIYKGHYICDEFFEVSNSFFKGNMYIENAVLWWPVGYGVPNLYDLELDLIDNNIIIDTITKKVGIRTCIIQSQKDELGESFIFDVNGEKIFAKGANWIPADSFLPNIDPERYKDLLMLAADVNINMLRVWGGGIYEAEEFYDTCDKLGIMVWQDFMYSCAEYPDMYEWFRKESKNEAEFIVKSLSYHCSIVLWCGNNENNWGFYDWWHTINPEYFGNKLYSDIFPDVCEKYAPLTLYHTSSPFGGKHPNGMDSGDRHSWDVWNGSEIDAYLKDTGRFISEFGFQSMPCLDTVYKYTAHEERFIGSDTLLAHNKNVGGMNKLKKYMTDFIGFPKDFEAFVLLSQFVQAQAIKTGVEHWRTRKWDTAGTLFWQFNDCWPVASWSAIDYYNRKKALYYYLKDIYCPILIKVNGDLSGVSVTIVNDTLSDCKCKLILKAYALDGTYLGKSSNDYVVSKNEKMTTDNINLSSLGIKQKSKIKPVEGFCALFSDYDDCTTDDVVLFAELYVKESIVAINIFTFTKYCNLKIKKPNFTYSIVENKAIITSDKPAFFVCLISYDDAQPYDNYFNMEPYKRYIIEFNKNISEITIKSLSDLVL